MVIDHELMVNDHGSVVVDLGPMVIVDGVIIVDLGLMVIDHDAMVDDLGPMVIDHDAMVNNLGLMVIDHDAIFVHHDGDVAGVVHDAAGRHGDVTRAVDVDVGQADIVRATPAGTPRRCS